MRDERTLVMSNVRSPRSSFVTLDDAALNDLETAARMVGASVASVASIASVAGHAALRGPSTFGPARGMAGAKAARPDMATSSGPGVAALFAGGVVALATAATVAFYLVAS